MTGRTSQAFCHGLIICAKSHMWWLIEGNKRTYADGLECFNTLKKDNTEIFLLLPQLLPLLNFLPRCPDKESQGDSLRRTIISDYFSCRGCRKWENVRKNIEMGRIQKQYLQIGYFAAAYSVSHLLRTIYFY